MDSDFRWNWDARLKKKWVSGIFGKNRMGPAKRGINQPYKWNYSRPEA